MRSPTSKLALRSPLLTALALSLGAAISLGISRFSYGLLLPEMRLDLGWSYLLAGAMNTGNALGYLFGALATPPIMRRCNAQIVLLIGAILTSIFMWLCGFVLDANILLAQRMLAGFASALIFIAGGVLIARLSAMHPKKSGLIIGLYYGGTGIGIVISTIVVPLTQVFTTHNHIAHAWQWTWLLLGVVCFLATLVMMMPVRDIDGAPASSSNGDSEFVVGPFAFSLAAYFMFGVGYIGYMTFVIALLRDQGMPAFLILSFYGTLGVAVIASSRIWAGMLDRFKGGESLAILSGIVGVAIVLPVLTAIPALIFVSGMLFGAVFLSVVASTTALVRHNLPQAAWPSGISMFTIVFALGQIVGPMMVGWIADSEGGLKRGLLCSAAALIVGALLATQQHPLVKNGR
jgi:predicted MFS family arabinose efflux permease